ncbi:hypothetical protein AAVH_39092, partial [Aphelenchoides avenae]
MVTRDDRYYAVNVNIGSTSLDLQNFTLAVDLTAVDTVLGDISLEPRRGRGYVLHEGTSVKDNFTTYYTVNDNIQFSSSFGVTEEITVLKEWKTSKDIDQTYQAYKSQPFDGVLGLTPTDIAQYSMSFEKTCANDTTTDAGVLTINGLDEHGCDSFVFFENTLGYNCGIMSVACSLVSVHNVSDYSGTVRTAVIANLPYIYLPTATFNRLNAVYNATKVGDVYVVDCRADMGPLQ